MPNVKKTENEWRKQLSSEQFSVLRKKATEAPFSGKYDSVFDPGSYSCAACGAKLFESTAKFDAQCGWPSFYDAIPGSVAFHQDSSFGAQRTEVTCANCGGHLGHVFKGEKFDTPIDQRYCINSLSLEFAPKK